jgi:hypothetical protein
VNRHPRLNPQHPATGVGRQPEPTAKVHCETNERDENPLPPEYHEPTDLRFHETTIVERTRLIVPFRVDGAGLNPNSNAEWRI